MDEGWGEVTRYTLHVPLNDNHGVPRWEFLDFTRGALRDAGFDGWTEVPADGYWQGYRDRLTLIMVDSDADDAGDRLQDIAAALCETADQECVYLTETPITTRLVTRAKEMTK